MYTLGMYIRIDKTLAGEKTAHAYDVLKAISEEYNLIYEPQELGGVVLQGPGTEKDLAHLFILIDRLRKDPWFVPHTSEWFFLEDEDFGSNLLAKYSKPD